MAGFEIGSSVIGSDLSANCPTTTALEYVSFPFAVIIKCDETLLILFLSCYPGLLRNMMIGTN